MAICWINKLRREPAHQRYKEGPQRGEKKGGKKRGEKRDKKEKMERERASIEREGKR